MRLGIYGGSFNPPHLGHLHAAVSAADFLKLDRLLLIPAGLPPHKELAADSPTAEQRAEMTRLMAEQAELTGGFSVQVSRMELERAGKSYTADTLLQLREQYPDAELWLLMGTDMFMSFHQWSRPESILSCAGLCAFGRSEADTEEMFAVRHKQLTELWPEARIVTLSLPNLVEVSSTQLRSELPAGGGAEFLAPQIYGYILREHLYGTNLNLKHLTPEELRPVALSYLKARRVRHVLGVEEEAVRLARRYGADERRARIAALLHDCTKKLSMAEQLSLCTRYGVELDEAELENLKLLHAKTGAEVAKHIFGADDEICGAIRWHTTGRPGMTLLEKVIYLADYIEPSRDFDGVAALREAVYTDLNRALELGLRMSIEELRQRGEAVHHDTSDAYEWVKGI